MSAAEWSTTLWDLSHRHETFSAFRSHVAGADHERLADIAANTLLNEWCAAVADYSEREDDPQGHGKRLPYIGWYWRSVDFARKRIPIGDCGDFIGFMENNKWAYPQRDLTDEEAEKVIGLLWQARTAASGGGNLADLYAARDKVLAELWDLMQTFTGLESSW